MTHDEAVRIARSGEGAVVAELMRLDRKLRCAEESLAARLDRIEEMVTLIDKIRGQQ